GVDNEAETGVGSPASLDSSEKVYFMKALSNRTGFVVIGFATAVLGLGGAGCASKSDNNGGGGTGTGGGGSADTCTATNALQLAFNPMYSAFVDDPSLTFQLPSIVN